MEIYGNSFRLIAELKRVVYEKNASYYIISEAVRHTTSLTTRQNGQNFSSNAFAVFIRNKSVNIAKE